MYATTISTIVEASSARLVTESAHWIYRQLSEIQFGKTIRTLGLGGSEIEKIRDFLDRAVSEWKMWRSAVRARMLQCLKSRVIRTREAMSLGDCG